MPFKDPIKQNILRWLKDDNPNWFPPVEQTLSDPAGLLAAGGDLSVERLVAAYKHGIFPWFSKGEPPLWWSPDPRGIIIPEKIHVSRSLKRFSRKHKVEVFFDAHFEDVIEGCSRAKLGDHGTWITDEVKAAYIKLYKKGYAHSVEVKYDGKLAGGLYGVAIGKVFFAESKFTVIDNGSKFALIALAKQLQAWKFGMIDCQFLTPHLKRLGAESVDKSDFYKLFNRYIKAVPAKKWEFDSGTFMM